MMVQTRPRWQVGIVPALAGAAGQEKRRPGGAPLPNERANGRGYASGICFFGSTNGISTTTALRSPHSVDTPSDVPRFAYCVGTHA